MTLHGFNQSVAKAGYLCLAAVTKFTHEFDYEPHLFLIEALSEAVVQVFYSSVYSEDTRNATSERKKYFSSQG